MIQKSELVIMLNHECVHSKGLVIIYQQGCQDQYGNKRLNLFAPSDDNYFAGAPLLQIFSTPLPHTLSSK